MEEILGMITTKSMFLIKLNVPVHFKDEDSQISMDGCSGSFKLLKRHSSVKAKPDFEITWEDRLRKWRQMQTSKGAIRDLTDIKEEVRQYGITSILALL